MRLVCAEGFFDAAAAESDEHTRGVILDYDGSGDLISLEILDASMRFTNPHRFDFHVVE